MPNERRDVGIVHFVYNASYVPYTSLHRQSCEGLIHQDRILLITARQFPRSSIRHIDSSDQSNTALCRSKCIIPLQRNSPHTLTPPALPSFSTLASTILINALISSRSYSHLPFNIKSDPITTNIRKRDTLFNPPIKLILPLS